MFPRGELAAGLFAGLQDLRDFLYQDVKTDSED
jgi:hypothetical protein